MRIGFVIRYFNKASGGSENYTYCLARELAKNKKHEVHVFCSDKQEKDEIIEGIHVHRCREKFAIKYYFSFYPSITKKLLEYNPDIVHAIGFGFIQNEMAINKLKKQNPGVKIICTPHGPFMALNKYSLLGSMFKRAYTVLLRNYIKKYNLFLEDNPYQEEWMMSEYHIPKSKIKFLPPGMDKTAFNSSKPKASAMSKKYNLRNKSVISYLGRIQRYKGLGQIIEILPEIIKSCPNLIFIAMGRDADDMQRLKQLAESLSVEKNVIFTGQVSDEEKYALLDLSEVFIFPSEWEAFGIVLLEAMAHKNALISTRTEGGKYLVKKENGLLFDYQNKEELLQKLRIVLANPSLRKKMQNNNYKKAKNFLWQDIAKNLEKIYETILK